MRGFHLYLQGTTNFDDNNLDSALRLQKSTAEHLLFLRCAGNVIDR